MPTTFPGRPLRARGLAGTLLLSLVCAGSVLSGCSNDPTVTPDATASPEGTASHVGAPAPSELATTSEIGRVVGRLPGQRRRAVRKQVTAVVDRWWEAAYLSDAGPTSAAFPGFTAGARKRAKYDRALMSNANLDAVSVTPLMRKVRLDLLAVDRRARSVTARFELRFRATTSARTGRVRVRGRVFLTRRTNNWQVFGYDVSKGWL